MLKVSLDFILPTNVSDQFMLAFLNSDVFHINTIITSAEELSMFMFMVVILILSCMFSGQ